MECNCTVAGLQTGPSAGRPRGRPCTTPERTGGSLMTTALIRLLFSPPHGDADRPGPPGDFPQWRGPNRDGVIAVFTAPATWPERLTRKWKVDVGLGYATPVLVGNRVYMFCASGRQRSAEGARRRHRRQDLGVHLSRRRSPSAPPAARHEKGPKSTPTFAGGKLFTLGMTSVVTAFDAATGKQLWQKPATPIQPLYHTAMSPLVDRGLVIVHVGGHNKGSLTAYDVNTGAVKWHWDGDGPGYGSPIAVDVDGTRQIVVFTQENLVGVSAATGELLWKRPFSTPYSQNAITPMLTTRP